MHRRSFAAPPLAALLLAGLCSHAFAVIGVTLKLSSLFERAQVVIIGEVASVDVSGRTLHIVGTATAKGEAPEGRIVLEFAEGVEFPKATPEEPAVVVTGLRGAVIHVADGWLAAKKLDDSGARWQVMRNDGPTLDYPGRTGPLVQVMKDIQEGKQTIAYSVDHTVFKGGLRKLADIHPNPQALAAADVDGDGREDVLVVGMEKSQLFLNREEGLQESQARIREAGGGWAAAGDIDGDGDSDFLVGDTLWINEGGGFTAAVTLDLEPEWKIIAAAILDATGNDLADVLLATDSGQVIVLQNPGPASGEWKRREQRLWMGGEPVRAAAFSNDWGDTGKPHLLVIRIAGPTRYALEPDGGPPADLQRLAGNPPSWGEGSWDILGGTPLDVDGNGLMDFYAAGREFGAILNNRGFGTFFGNYSAKRVHGPKGLEWGTLTSATVLGSADLHGDGQDDVLVATEDGRLFEVDNYDVGVSY